MTGLPEPAEYAGDSTIEENSTRPLAAVPEPTGMPARQPGDAQQSAHSRAAIWLGLGWASGWGSALAFGWGFKSDPDTLLGAGLALACAAAACLATVFFWRQQRNLEALERSAESRLEERLASLVDLELEFNPDDLRIHRAAGGTRLLGMPAGSLPGRTLPSLWPVQSWERQTIRLTQEATGGTFLDLEFTHSDGRPRVAQALVGAGSHPGLCWLGLREVTSERAAEREAEERSMAMEFTNQYITGLNQDLEVSRQELEQAKERLAELNESKSRFLAVAAHELRTPMTAAKSAVSVLQMGMMGPVSEQQGEVLTIIHQNVDRLVRLVNDLLDLARIEAGKVDLNYQEFQSHALLQQSADLLAAEAGRKSIRIHVDGPPLVWVADPDRAQQIVLNLLGNAVKFTPEGGTVRLEATRTGEGLQISIRDSGAGISEQELPLLFKPFERLNNETTRKAAGTGLGLSISRELVELHGGRIWAESVLGQGTSIFFTLPEVAAPPIRAQAC